MKHAFLITAYTDAGHLTDLVDSLQSDSSSFYIHLDKKSPIKNHNKVFALKKLSNVHFIEDPLNVYWGGFSHLKAILLLMSEACKDTEAGYLHLLSGQCFPVRPLNEIKKFFIENEGKEFITCADLNSMNWTGGNFNRLQLYHLNDWFNIRIRFWKRINSRFLQLQRGLGVKRRLPLTSSYYAGGTWWSLSCPAVKHILETLEKAPGLLKSLRRTHCAEEIIFQTILMNSGFKNKIVSEDLRYIDWNTRNGICPVVLDESDLWAIKKSNKLFARKFVSGVSDKLKAEIRK